MTSYASYFLRTEVGLKMTERERERERENCCCAAGRTSTRCVSFQPTERQDLLSAVITFGSATLGSRNNQPSFWRSSICDAGENSCVQLWLCEIWYIHWRSRGW